MQIMHKILARQFKQHVRFGTLRRRLTIDINVFLYILPKELSNF